MQKTVVCVVGTRPEAVKMAPVIRALHDSPDFICKVILTGQHREMLDQVMRQFELKGDADLDIMSPRQTLLQITTRALEGLDRVYAELKPDIVLAQGDTTTVFAAALTAFYAHIPFAHVEAGLRTFNKYSPFPEEMNRRLAGVLTDLHFAPTPESAANLVREGYKDNIYVTGNTVTDALIWAAERGKLPEDLKWIDSINGPLILVTAHRRENWGEPLRQSCLGMLDLIEKVPNAHLIYAVHKNPVVQEIAKEILGNHPRVKLIDPPDYFDFIQIMKRARLILTDSGGIQEEAPSLGVPVLVLRDTTERPEAIGAGVAKLIGPIREKIVEEGLPLLIDDAEHAKMARAANPYGDGKACARIVGILKYFFEMSKEIPDDFKV